VNLLEQRLLGFIDRRLKSMLRAPAVWGSDEGVELQVLQLLELRLVALAPLPDSIRDSRVQDEYVRYLATEFPGSPPETLDALLERFDRRAEFSALLGRFVEHQLQRPVVRALDFAARAEREDTNAKEIRIVQELLQRALQFSPASEDFDPGFGLRPVEFPITQEPPNA